MQFILAFIISLKELEFCYCSSWLIMQLIYTHTSGGCMCSVSFHEMTLSLTLRPLGFDYRVFCTTAKVCSLGSICFTSMLCSMFNVGLWDSVSPSVLDHRKTLMLPNMVTHCLPHYFMVRF